MSKNKTIPFKLFIILREKYKSTKNSATHVTKRNKDAQADTQRLLKINGVHLRKQKYHLSQLACQVASFIQVHKLDPKQT